MLLNLVHSVVATVSNPELFNGTVISCDGQSLTIEVPGRSKLISLVNATLTSSVTSLLCCYRFCAYRIECFQSIK